MDPAITTGAFTLAAGLGTVVATAWVTRREREAVREVQHVEAQRAALLELVDAAHAWCNAADGVVLAVAVVADAVELTKMDSFETFAATNRAWSRALIAARLTVSEPSVRACLLRVSKVAEQWSEAIGEVSMSAHRLGKAAPEPIGRAHGVVEALRTAVVNLEDTTVDKLR